MILGMRRCAVLLRSSLQMFSETRHFYTTRFVENTEVGQPSYESHPHLLTEGEVTPGFTAAEYRQRRRLLAEKLPLNGVALISAASPRYFPSTVIPYPNYRQDADFAYLTGVLQPGVTMMLERRHGISSEDAGIHYTLFVPSRNIKDEIWNGPRIGKDAAVRFFGADAAYEAAEMGTVVSRALQRSSMLFADIERLCFDASRVVFPLVGLMCRGASPKSLHPLIHSLRWKKSSTELDTIRRSVQVDIQGFREAIRTSGPRQLENVVSAHHEHRCKVLGADRLAYPSVVGGGTGALVVHYAAMDKVLNAGQLLLMDAGCEWRGYVSDITRTWPITGEFSTAQADVYDAVHQTHVACLKAAKQGVSLNELHMLSVSLLSESIVNLGVRQSKTGLKQREYTQYYPHFVGHWIGMDTHDTPSISTSTPIQPGCVFTIEPGLYFPVHDPSVPKGLRGIGVRIEDNVALNLNGDTEILSGSLPVSRSGIENLVREVRKD